MMYEDWILELTRKYPDCEIIPTRYGAEVWDGDELIEEFDYDPNPFAEQRVRY